MSNKTTRDHIIDAADQLFYRQGYEHTSFSDIADTVQISRGNFYHHFKTKDEILDAVIDLRLTNTRNMLEQWEIEGKQPEDRIRRFIHILIGILQIVYHQQLCQIIQNYILIEYNIVLKYNIGYSSYCFTYS